MKVIIDGRFVLDLPDLHRRLAGSFGYGPTYRHDFTSLRSNLLAGDPRPLQLTWINAAAIRMAVGTPAYRDLVTMLETVESADEGKDWNHRFVFHLFD